MKTRKVKKHFKLNVYNVLVLLTGIISLIVLLHDLIFWAIIPFFTKDFVMLTYSGMFLDFVALCMLEVSSQIMKEW